MSSPQARVNRRALLVITIALAVATGCASTAGMQRGHQAELAQDFDRAVVEFTKVARADPSNTDARLAWIRPAPSPTASASGRGSPRRAQPRARLR